LKIALIGNISDTCGIATYGEDLIKYAPDDIQYVPINPNSKLDLAVKMAQNCDLIHLNYYYGIQASFSYLEFLNKTKKPSILTNHATNKPENWFNLVDILVTHEVPDAIYHKRMVKIFHGIPEKDFKYESHPEFVISQAGFPFPWKNFWKTCMAANEISDLGYEIRVKLFMPSTYRQDVRPEIEKCVQVIKSNISMYIDTQWLEEDELIYSLHRDASVISCYTGGSYYGNGAEGPSGSARLAVASKRPIIVNGNAPQYAGLIGHSGIYPVYKDNDLASSFIMAHKTGGYASDLLMEQSYHQIMRKYQELYCELLK